MDVQSLVYLTLDVLASFLPPDIQMARVIDPDAEFHSQSSNNAYRYYENQSTQDAYRIA